MHALPQIEKAFVTAQQCFVKQSLVDLYRAAQRFHVALDVETLDVREIAFGSQRCASVPVRRSVLNAKTLRYRPAHARQPPVREFFRLVERHWVSMILAPS